MSHRPERLALSPQDQGTREREIGRADASGVPIKTMEREFGMDEGQITAVVRDSFPHIPLRAPHGGKRRAS